jgi:hypothetical protein
MPRYQWTVTVPAGTDRVNAETASIDVDEQIVSAGFRHAAPGATDSVRAEVVYGDKLLLPEPGSTRVVLPATTNPAPLNYQLSGTPATLELRAWAPNSNFPHTVTAQIDTERVDDEPEVVRLARRSGPGRSRLEEARSQLLSGGDGEE